MAERTSGIYSLITVPAYYTAMQDMLGGRNGPEYISATLLNWAAKRYITIMQIQPGKPQQNAYIELSQLN